ncbi:MAG: hypothetical protein PG981_000513 [Wolbachia endosymbiont of Ctenocephalides orientis wCori]|nr:MAG: hypothetical protein PG981_000513 [Wolbachia endosymbiont of Ctenocephalides orientis wCori]
MAISFKNLDVVKLLLEHPDIDFYIRNNYEVRAEMYDIP